MSQDIIYTDSAIVDKLVQHFSNYKEDGHAGDYFYDLFFKNILQRKKVEIPLKVLEPVWNILPSQKHMFRRLISQAIIKFLKQNRPAYVIDGLIAEEHVDWEVV